MSKESTLRSASLSATHEQYLNEEMKRRTPIRSEPEKEVDTMPEGGMQAWLTVAGSFIVQFCAFGYSVPLWPMGELLANVLLTSSYSTSFGVYQDFYTREYLSNESSSTISQMDREYQYLSGVGEWDNSWEVVRSRILLLAIMGRITTDIFLAIFLSQGLGAGLGAGILYVPSIAIVSQYFRERRALVMTIVASGSSLGAFLHPLMLNNTINGSLGFANGTRANAGLISGLLLISCIIMRTRLPPPNQIPSLSKALGKISHDWAFIFASVGLLIFAIGYYFPLFYLQLDATTRGLDTTFAFYTVSITETPTRSKIFIIHMGCIQLVIMNASSFVGRLTPGVLSQRGVSVANMFSVSCGGCSILIFGMIGVTSDAGFVIFGIVYGFFAGMFVALLGPILSLLTEDLTELGARMGVAYLLTGGLIGTPINGALLTDKLIWWRPAVFSGSVTSVSCVLFLGMLIVLHHKKRAQAESQTHTRSNTARYR
ncbi:hypothetical protein D9758_010200 [Tetrapyrgos nigripes]|uniref:Uncharacterized protein n=1 Tax=Tetrapyrgos nigripes TaxID=182062 RepID=A0A8H5FU46_9AGAR|nr:hypothetical protein D9758_010200 [Tetrapyrgos nigripes]